MFSYTAGFYSFSFTFFGGLTMKEKPAAILGKKPAIFQPNSAQNLRFLPEKNFWPAPKPAVFGENPAYFEDFDLVTLVPGLFRGSRSCSGHAWPFLDPTRARQTSTSSTWIVAAHGCSPLQIQGPCSWNCHLAHLTSGLNLDLSKMRTAKANNI